MADGTVSVSFSGDIPGALRRGSRPIAERYRATGEVILRRNCPVDSGELLASCYAELDETPDGMRVRLGARADHAAPVEFGHLMPNGQFYPPNPFIRRSLAQLVRGQVIR